MEKKNKPFLTLFLVLVPSLLLAMTAAISLVWTRIFFQAVLILFQLVVMKSIIDDYYGEQ